MYLIVRSLNGSSVAIELPESSSVLELKELVAEKTRHPIPYQKLIYRGKQLEDHQTLQQLGICNEASLFLVVKEESAIVEELEPPADFPLNSPSSSSLSLAGSSFANVENDYKLSDGTSEEPEFPSVEKNSVCSTHSTQIFIKLKSGESFGVDIELSANASELKARIQQHTEVLSSSQRLFFRGKEVPDHAALSACGIGVESTIHMVQRKATERKAAIERKEEIVVPVAPPAPIREIYMALSDRELFWLNFKRVLVDFFLRYLISPLRIVFTRTKRGCEIVFTHTKHLLGPPLHYIGDPLRAKTERVVESVQGAVSRIVNISKAVFFVPLKRMSSQSFSFCRGACTKTWDAGYRLLSSIHTEIQKAAAWASGRAKSIWCEVSKPFKRVVVLCDDVKRSLSDVVTKYLYWFYHTLLTPSYNVLSTNSNKFYSLTSTYIYQKLFLPSKQFTITFYTFSRTFLNEKLLPRSKQLALTSSSFFNTSIYPPIKRFSFKFYTYTKTFIYEHLFSSLDKFCTSSKHFIYQKLFLPAKRVTTTFCVCFKHFISQRLIFPISQKIVDVWRFFCRKGSVMLSAARRVGYLLKHQINLRVFNPLRRVLRFACARLRQGVFYVYSHFVMPLLRVCVPNMKRGVCILWRPSVRVVTKCVGCVWPRVQRVSIYVSTALKRPFLVLRPPSRVSVPSVSQEFLVDIPQGRMIQEGGEWLCLLPHDKVYQVCLQAEVSCNAQISIDGNDMGLWRLDANQRYTIERPAACAQRFVFVRDDTVQPGARGTGNNGQLAVTFTSAETHRTVRQKSAKAAFLPSIPTPSKQKAEASCTAKEDVFQAMPETDDGMEDETKTSAGKLPSGVTVLRGESAQQFSRVYDRRVFSSTPETVTIRMALDPLSASAPSVDITHFVDSFVVYSFISLLAVLYQWK